MHSSRGMSHSKPPSFVILEAKTPAAELAFQDAILFDEVIDHVLLMAVDPTGDGDDEELPRLNGSHVGRW